MKAYPQDGFLDSSICSLLKKIKVSPVSTYPIKLRGTIIGRGVPGNIFSEDMLLRDKTGMIFLDYQQPIGLFNLIFALFRSKDYQGQDVMVEGWYRRAPMPYVEIKKVVSSLGSSTVQTYKFKMLFFMLLPLLAWFLSRTCR
jgi:hypothetical protein